MVRISIGMHEELFLCHFSSHWKPLWLICLLGAGPGSLRTLLEELFLVIFWQLHLLGKVQTALAQHHPENTLSRAPQNAWKSALLSQEGAIPPSPPALMSQTPRAGLLCVTFASSLLLAERHQEERDAQQNVEQRTPFLPQLKLMARVLLTSPTLMLLRIRLY